MQPVAEHPHSLRGLLVYLKVVGEAEGCRTAGQQALCDWLEWPPSVPASHFARGHQVVVHDAFRVHGHARRLTRLMARAPRIVERKEMLDDVTFAERTVAQRCGGHVELVVAGQWMEVEHPLSQDATVRRQAHAENTVHPVERYAIHAVMTVQRIWVEIRMIDPTRDVLKQLYYIIIIYFKYYFCCCRNVYTTDRYIKNRASYMYIWRAGKIVCFKNN